MKKLFLFCILGLIGLNATAFITDYDTTGCKPGRITTDLSAARKYAKQNGKFIFMIFAKSNGCGFCRNAAEYVWNAEDFRNWSKATDIPVVWADCSAMNYAANQFVDLYYESAISVPVIVLIDGADGTSKLGWDIFHGASIVNGNIGKNAPFDHKGVYVQPFDYTIVDDIVKFYINNSDNEIRGTAIGKHGYVPQAHQIVPDAETAKKLTVNGLWGTWLTNELSSVVHKTGGGSYVCTEDDPIDWYQFTCDKANTGYILKAPYLKDSKELGYVGIYADEASAAYATKLSKTDKDGAEKAIANAKKKAIKWCPLADLKSGASFTAPNKGTYYIAFVRRAADQKENITIKYNFTLQVGTTAAYEFAQKSFSFDEYATNGTVSVSGSPLVTNTVSLVLQRDNADAAESTTVKFTDDTAKKGVDYIVDSTTVSFKKGSRQANLPVKLISERGIYTGKRRFKASITKDPKEGGVVSTTVDILEVDYAKNDCARTPDVAKPLPVGCVTNRINYTNITNWYKVAGKAGLLYTLGVTNVLTRNVTRAKAYLYRGDPASDVLLAEGSTAGRFLVDFGFDRDVDYYVCIVRDAGTQPVTFVDEVTLLAQQMPVIGFKEDLSVPPLRNDLYVTNLIEATATELLPGSSDAAWSTQDGTATKGRDYVKKERTVENPYPSAKAIVQLLRADEWRPERTFTMALQPADFVEKFYLIGKTNATVTVAADAQGNDKVHPVVDLDETKVKVKDWVPVDSVARNVSADTGADWMTVTNVQNSATDETGAVTNAVLYRLRCDDLEIRPANAAVSVFVYTNGVAATDYGWQLASLTNDWPLMRFVGLEDGTIDLLVTNETGKATVLAEYKLSVSRWGEALDAFDPADDTDAGARTNALKTAAVELPRRMADTDRIDTFAFTNVQAGSWCRFDIAVDEDDMINVLPEDMFVEVALPGAKPVTNDFTFLESTTRVGTYQATAGGRAMVRVFRDTDARSTAEHPIALDYVLTAQEYTWPVIGFETNKLEVVNSADSVPVVVTRTGNTNVVSAVTVWTEASDWAKNVFEAVSNEVVFAAGETNKTVSVPLKRPAADVWRGDWKFYVRLAVDEGESHVGYKKASVRVKDVNAPALDEGTDPMDDTKEGVAGESFGIVPTTAVTNLVRHLNGSDTNDWFRFTGIKSDTTYRFAAANLVTANAKNLKATFYVDDTAVRTETLADLIDDSFDIASLGTGDIYVRVSRDASGGEAPVSVRYDLTACEMPWPVVMFGEALPAEVTNDVGSLRLKISRTDGFLDESAPFRLILTDTNATRVTVGASRELVFAPGVKTLTEAVEIVPGEEGFWTRGGDFEVALARSATNAAACVKIGTPSNGVIRVVDRNGYPFRADGNDFPSDDKREGAPSYVPQAVSHAATGNMAPKQKVAWLNGDDRIDWYRFTGLEADRVYEFRIEDFEKNSVDLKTLELRVYAGDAKTAFVTNTLAQLAGEPLKIQTKDTRDLYVQIIRSPVATASVKYSLHYRKVSSFVEFAESSASVSKASSQAEVEVFWNATMGDEVSFTVTPRDGTAKSPDNFDGSPITMRFTAGATNGFEKIRIPLRNADRKWTGDLNFSLDLSTDSPGLMLGDVTNMTVTVVEANPPQYGKVEVTHVTVRDKRRKAADVGTLTVWENEKVTFRLRRKSGLTGPIDGKWIWRDAAGTAVKTVSTRGIFAEGQSGSAEVDVAVPEAAGFKASADWTVTFALLSDSQATIVPGSVVKFAFKVRDANYAGKVATYSADDLTRVAFSAAGTSWYAGRGADGQADGSIRSGNLEIGETVVLTAPVKGPGTLYFDAEGEDLVNSTFKYSVDGASAKSIALPAHDFGIKVKANAHTVELLLKRSKKDPDTVAVRISNVRFVADDGFRTYGTFAGPVAVIHGSVTNAGVATLTVSASGRTSGKFTMPDRTWSFSTNGTWSADGELPIAVKSGNIVDPLCATLIVDPSTGCVTNAPMPVADWRFDLELFRNAWKDKPMLPGDAEALLEARDSDYWIPDEVRFLEGGADLPERVTRTLFLGAPDSVLED